VRDGHPVERAARSGVQRAANFAKPASYRFSLNALPAGARWQKKDGRDRRHLLSSCPALQYLSASTSRLRFAKEQAMRLVRHWIAFASLLAAGMLFERAGAADAPTLPAPGPEPILSLPPVSGPSGDDRPQRLPSVDASAGPGNLAAREPGAMPIDLATALRLADANNLQVAVAREQVSQAMAQVTAANALWLPSVRGGANYNRHEGSIQQVDGQQINTSRAAYYAGLGGGGYGAASPTVPGLYANFHLVDALFQPLAARQFAGSRQRAAAAVTNDTLLNVTLAYFELARASADVTIAQAMRADAGQLADLTAAYADTGIGLRSDANRAQAELAIRINDVERAREAQQVASARLAQLLRLDPTVRLVPADPAIAPIDVCEPSAPVKELVIQALSQRPELAESRLLVGEAVERLRREKLAVLIPSIILGASYGGMGSGINESLAPFHDRLDVDAIAYWEVRNFGLGEAAARRGAQSTLRASRLRELATMDQIAREVVEAHIQVQSRRGQVATARSGVDAALASQQQNLARIEQAKGLPIEALQSIQALAQARREFLRTVIDYNTAQFTLYRAVGWPVKQPRP
jgi:outer membrane protein TolC